MNPTPGRFFDKPAFREYVRMLGELVLLFREGRGESPEADALRDRMDSPGEQLDGEEIAAIHAMPDDILLNPPVNTDGQKA